MKTSSCFYSRLGRDWDFEISISQTLSVNRIIDFLVKTSSCFYSRLGRDWDLEISISQTLSVNRIIDFLVKTSSCFYSRLGRDWDLEISISQTLSVNRILEFLVKTSYCFYSRLGRDWDLEISNSRYLELSIIWILDISITFLVAEFYWESTVYIYTFLGKTKSDRCCVTVSKWVIKRTKDLLRRTLVDNSSPWELNWRGYAG